MIQSFKCKKTEKLARQGECHRAFHSIRETAERRLRKLEAAKALIDLKNPPSNRFEALKGDRKGQYSIRINDKWRICFTWSEAGPADVEIVDYH